MSDDGDYDGYASEFRLNFEHDNGHGFYFDDTPPIKRGGIRSRDWTKNKLTAHGMRAVIRTHTHTV